MTAKPTESNTSGELESLDDLISKRQLTKSSLPDRQPDNQNGVDSINSADDLNSSSLTIRPESSLNHTATRPRDKSRWNGFHLWRTESHNLRASRERDAAEVRQQANRQKWLAGLGESVVNWYANVVDSISGRKEEEEQHRIENDVEMSKVKMLLLTVVSAGTQVSAAKYRRPIEISLFFPLLLAGVVLGIWLWDTVSTLYRFLKADYIAGMASQSNHWVYHAAFDWSRF